MATRKKLRIATCQFPVTGDPRANGRHVRRWMCRAAAGGAHLVHFSEAALSGYPGVDLPSFNGYDWGALRRETALVRDLARSLRLWVALGSSHFVDAKVKPTNCVYLIDHRGGIVDRYDKSMCTTPDLRHYTPGDRRVTFRLRGVKLGLLICYDACHPEMYNAYRHLGVEVMLHSFHNAGRRGWTVLDTLAPAQVPCRAADNRMWIVANNSCRPYQSWATFVARPDSTVAGRLKRNTAGVLFHDFPDPKLLGWLHNYKMMKIHPREVFHRGTPVRHPRITNRRAEP